MDKNKSSNWTLMNSDFNITINNITILIAIKPYVIVF